MTWQNPNRSVQDMTDKMRRYPTKVINLIGGPGCDKSLVAAAIILQLHLYDKTVEHVPDFAKYLRWQHNFETLKNQFYIAQKQYKMLKVLDGEVQYIVAEGSLPQILYYNRNYKENICDVVKTEIQIKNWYSEFENINIFVERSNKPYLDIGRYQNEEEAREVDNVMLNILRKNNIPFTVLQPEIPKIDDFVKKFLSK